MRQGAANDVLNGSGGRDLLYGGAGRNTFVVKADLGPRDITTVMDFSSRYDTVKCDLDLDGCAMKRGYHKSKPSAYGLKNWNGDTKIAYNPKTGDVWFSTDWSSSEGGDGFRFSKLKPHLSLKASDSYLF
ncbi:hypothetical protein [Microvirga arsenatis]|uniref:hypothetical protein n=1 Tax=Microvirga arsenatis TaxID=2692265 RepID=UPI00191C4113